MKILLLIVGVVSKPEVVLVKSVAINVCVESTIFSVVWNEFSSIIGVLSKEVLAPVKAFISYDCKFELTFNSDVIFVSNPSILSNVAVVSVNALLSNSCKFVLSLIKGLDGLRANILSNALLLSIIGLEKSFVSNPCNPEEPVLASLDACKTSKLLTILVLYPFNLVVVVVDSVVWKSPKVAPVPIGVVFSKIFASKAVSVVWKLRSVNSPEFGILLSELVNSDSIPILVVVAKFSFFKAFPPAILVASKISTEEPNWFPPTFKLEDISPKISLLFDWGISPPARLNEESLPISLVTVWYPPNSASAPGIASTDGVKCDWIPFTFVVVEYSPNVVPSPWGKELSLLTNVSMFD